MWQYQASFVEVGDAQETYWRLIMKSGKAKYNGQTLYWESHGEGAPLVFDNRDVGRSSQATAAYTIADMADDVAGLMDGLVIERAHLLGLSMGGMIGQEFAIRHPGRLNRLVQYLWLFSESFRRNHQAVDQTLQMLAANPNPVSAAAYQRQADAYVKHDALDRLGQVTAPTIVITGEQDRLTPPWIMREVAEAIPNAQFQLIEGDGSSHVMPLERPDDFNRTVLAFLQGQDE
jgi:pimeloyl-ACP methyl ester carboxylesterase